MLRASNLPSLKQSPNLLFTLRYSAVVSHSFNSPNNNKVFSSSPPLSLLRPFAPISSSFPSPRTGWNLSMSGNSNSKGRASFSADASGGGGGREILVQHLLVSEDNLKLLLELQQGIAGGVDLSDLAVEYSICPSKEQGGMLGWVQKGQMVPEFEEAAFNAPLNKVVRCKTKYGWHLLEVLSEREEALLHNIEPEELHVKMQDQSFLEEAQLLDVREPDEVAQASLPGFQVFPLRQFENWAPEITNKFDTQKDTYVMGFKRVYNVSGGIHAYSEKADPSIPTY